MNSRALRRSNYAISGVVEALLLVALVAIILATIQLVYIPDIMTDKENDHISEVEKQFSYLKSNIDIQSMTKEKILISSPITLGSKELPYFVTMGAIGFINIYNEIDVGDSEINTNKGILDIPEYVNGVPLTSIKYEAENTYTDNCKYILEGGGIISIKSGEEKMMVKPSIIVEDGFSDITIYYNLPLFNTISNKKSESCGYGNADKTIFVRTNYTTYETSSNPDVNITISTDYPDAWHDALVGFSGLLTEYNGTDINVTINKLTTPPQIKITKGLKNINLELIVVKIGVQIGPGTIKS